MMTKFLNQEITTTTAISSVKQQPSPDVDEK
jgi:hypothetical protein